MKDGKFIINLEIAGRTYPITIERGDEELEYNARQAARRIQEYLLLIRQRFAKSVEERDLLAMVLIQLTIKLIQTEHRNDTRPYEEKLRQLTDELEAYLNNKT